MISHLACRDCGGTYDLNILEYPCQECGGILDPQYDLDRIEINRSDWTARSGSMWKYHEFLPVRDRGAVVSMGEGNTPFVECPTIADRLGVNELFVKDEGQNPTSTFKDRGQSVAISAAVERGVETVALPSAGNAGQSASAYAARAGLDCHVFLNHQAGELKKDLIRLHDADLHLVDGNITDAGSAFDEAREEHGWYSVATFQTPFRHEGKKTMGYEIFEALGWSTPDEIMYPTGGGVGLIGIWKAYQELTELGWLDADAPKLTVAQSKGAAPVVEAIEERRSVHEPLDSPETIARGVEIPDPGASPWILEAVYESGGAGIAVTDENAVDAALEMGRADGIEMCVTSAVAMAGAMRRADEGAYDGDETVVVINTGAGCKTAARLGQRAQEKRTEDTH